MASINPNFPEFLDICGSAPPNQDSSNNFNEEAGFTIFDQDSAISQYGIAGRIWEAAYVFDTYLTRPVWSFYPPCPFLRNEIGSSPTPLTVLELGSGTGYVGFAVAKTLLGKARGHGADLPDRAIVTDLPDVCPLLEENQRRDAQLVDSPILLVRPLAWGNAKHARVLVRELLSSPESQITHIICSDLVYFPELLAPLLRTLIILTNIPTSSNTTISPTQVLISYKVRSLSKEALFWAAFGLWFDFEPVLFRPSLDGEWVRFGSQTNAEALSFMFVARRKDGSAAWQVPDDDAELLTGVGALGTASRKADETFETLLLMNVDAF